VDQDLTLVESKLAGHPNGVAHSFNALDSKARTPYIEKADLVISMLPAIYHVGVAQDCIALKKHLITPSYISAEMRALDAAAKEAGVIIMNEIGVDPGIDHMSAMKIIHHIQAEGGELESFKSYCGGLIAPQSDTNGWHYKFTWNPRNVVLAGQGSAAIYKEAGALKYLPYHRLFQQTEFINVPNYGQFEAYANRNSISYLETYGLQDLPTIIRGTLRVPPYCAAWNALIQLGLTEDTYTIKNEGTFTPRMLLNTFIPFKDQRSVEQKLAAFLGENAELLPLFEEIGLFDATYIFQAKEASPAQYLQELLEKAWKLAKTDNDMLVMYHEFIYKKAGKNFKIESSMVAVGTDQRFTAMSDTVGLPVGIAARLILNQTITQTGVTLPVYPEIYTPILLELEQYGITFNETEKQL
jgi:saccharopine dehydrogenase (NAD+, L-glutamate forming)